MDIQEFIITSETSGLEAMKKLDSNANKILFVVGGSMNLLGSLTDGDIRRWILEGKDLNSNAINICNPNPTRSYAHYDVEEIKSLMLEHKIECIPVVDNEDKIKQLLFWTDLFAGKEIPVEKEPLDLPVVIMAGGFGTRMKPFTTILPKPLIPIGDKSIVERIIDRFREHDIKSYFMTLNHKSRIIRSYFEDLDKDYTVDFVNEDQPLGTAGSLKLLEDRLPEKFIVSNCDILIKANYADIVAHHNKYDYEITLVTSMMNYKIPYGICEIDKGGELLEIREKPEYSFLISTGMYIVNKRTLDLIPDGEMFHITHLMDKIKERGGKVGVYPISENSWLDTGQWDEYDKTVKILSREG